jgi:ubiquinone/menaquinone biosynthesis C-methylase UbiE/predicted membrane protein
MKNEVIKMTRAAMMIALGVLLPMAFHAIPNAGGIFLPMHLPVLLAGFLCGPFYGALVGVVTPLLSSLWTGMPPVAMLPGMIAELCAYGFFSGLFYRLIKTKNLYLDLYACLLLSMLLGRLVGGFANAMIYLSKSKSYTWQIFLTGYFVTGIWGILIQLVAIPLIMVALTKSHLIKEDERYFSSKKIQQKEAERQQAFFDQLAQKWDEKEQRDPSLIASLLNSCSLRKEDDVLDLACGSGILEEELSKRTHSVLALDVSSKMIEEAKSKHHLANVQFVQSDFYAFKSLNKFDVILVYDAYPHFLDVDAFVSQCAALLKKGGRLVIFFDASKESINHHHQGSAEAVSRELQSVAKEAFPYWLHFKKGRLEEDDKHYFLELVRR